MFHPKWSNKWFSICHVILLAMLFLLIVKPGFAVSCDDLRFYVVQKEPRCNSDSSFTVAVENVNAYPEFPWQSWDSAAISTSTAIGLYSGATVNLTNLTMGIYVWRLSCIDSTRPRDSYRLNLIVDGIIDCSYSLQLPFGSSYANLSSNNSTTNSSAYDNTNNTIQIQQQENSSQEKTTIPKENENNSAPVYADSTQDNASYDHSLATNQTAAKGVENPNETNRLETNVSFNNSNDNNNNNNPNFLPSNEYGSKNSPFLLVLNLSLFVLLLIILIIVFKRIVFNIGKI